MTSYQGGSEHIYPRRRPAGTVGLHLHDRIDDTHPSRYVAARRWTASRRRSGSSVHLIRTMPNTKSADHEIWVQLGIFGIGCGVAQQSKSHAAGPDGPEQLLKNCIATQLLSRPFETQCSFDKYWDEVRSGLRVLRLGFSSCQGLLTAQPGTSGCIAPNFTSFAAAQQIVLHIAQPPALPLWPQRRI